MVKRLFEYLALGILATLGLARLKGKRVNPMALRALLGILSFMAYCLDSRMILLCSGTWLLFLLAGDAAAKFGFDLRLFVPALAEGDIGTLASEAIVSVDEPSSPVLEPANKSFWTKRAERLKAFLSGK